MEDILNKIDFNSLINAANNNLYCDAECQRKKKETELREKLNRAALTIEKAPENYNKVKKEYIEFIHGTNYYNEYKIEEDTRDFSKSINPFLNELKLKHNELREIEKNKKNIYKTITILEKTKKETSDELNKVTTKLDKIETTVNTTKKREVYENENKISLMSFLKINTVFFYGIIILSILYYLFSKKTVTLLRFIGIVCVIVFYGFIVDYYTIK